METETERLRAALIKLLRQWSSGAGTLPAEVSCNRTCFQDAFMYSNMSMGDYFRVSE